MQGFQVCNPVNAASETLLTNNQNGQDRYNRLHDDREVHITDTTGKHRETDDEGKQDWNDDDGKQSKPEAMERFPKAWQAGDLVPVHKVWNSWRGLRCCRLHV